MSIKINYTINLGTKKYSDYTFTLSNPLFSLENSIDQKIEDEISKCQSFPDVISLLNDIKNK